MKNNLRERAKTLAVRPYTVRILRDDSEIDQPLYLALNPELEGCIAQGETIKEAEQNLAEFRVDYIEHLLQHDLPVPYPESMATVTGNVSEGAFSTFTFEVSPTKKFDDVPERGEQSEDRERQVEASLKTSG